MEISNILSLSKTIQHAIQAMIYIDLDKGKSKVSKIAEECNIPASYLSKIVQKLSTANLLETSTGRTGGILLGKPSTQIKVSDIITAVSYKEKNKDLCILGIDRCTDLAKCPIHDSWKPLKDKIARELGGKTLKELTQGMIKKKKILIENASKF